MAGLAFPLEVFNEFLHNVLVPRPHDKKTFVPASGTNIDVSSVTKEDHVRRAYCDFINVFCLLNNIRNGAHLDAFVEIGAITLKDPPPEFDEYDFIFALEKNIFIDNLLLELTKLSLQRFPWLKLVKRHAATVWNSEKISNEQVLNSWAFKGDYKNDDTEYWANNALLFGNELGYPTYVKGSRRSWSLELTIRMDGNDIEDSISMCGGGYNGEESDMASIRRIEQFLNVEVVGKPLFNPDGNVVVLSKVELVFPPPKEPLPGGSKRRYSKKIRRVRTRRR